MNLFINIRWIDVLDIFLFAFLLFQLYYILKGTPAINIFVGILIVYLLYVIVKALNMELFSTILGKFIDVGVIVLIVVFQQEIRKFLLMIGSRDFLEKNRLLSKIFSLKFNVRKRTSLDVNQIVKACKNMSATKTGAIIVLPKSSDLSFYSSTGDLIDAKISSRMLESIFYKNSPLHDGAIIISNNRILAARCVMPVTENPDFPANLGMRHRASIGITEVTDATAIAISEQTGEISIAKNGQLNQNKTPEELKEYLEQEFAV